MSPGLLAPASWLAAFAGFAALSLAMDRHFEDGFGRGRSPGRARPWLRLAGTLALALSFAGAVALEGPAHGWVLWLGGLTAAGLGVVLLQAYAPRQVARLAPAAAVLGAALLALAALL